MENCPVVFPSNPLLNKFLFTYKHTQTTCNNCFRLFFLVFSLFFFHTVFLFVSLLLSFSVFLFFILSLFLPHLLFFLSFSSSLSIYFKTVVKIIVKNFCNFFLLFLPLIKKNDFRLKFSINFFSSHLKEESQMKRNGRGRVLEKIRTCEKKKIR